MRSMDAVRQLEQPGEDFDLRRRFPTLPEEYAQSVLEDMHIKPKEMIKQYAYILSLAEYFGRGFQFPDALDRHIFEDNAREAIAQYSNADLNSEDEEWSDAMAVVRAYTQIFPGQPRELHLTDEAFDKHLPRDTDQWTPADFSLVSENAIELVSVRPDLRAKVEATITDNEVFESMWAGRQKTARVDGWNNALAGLAEITLVWPRARDFFRFSPGELEGIVKNQLEEEGGRTANLRVLWGAAVLTAEKAWIDDQGKVHLLPPRMVLAKAESLPPRSLIT